MTQNKIRKLFFIVLSLSFFVQLAYGQKIEVNFNAYSGLFSFHGNGATSNSWINSDLNHYPNKYTSNVYGKKAGFSYAFELQGQYITGRKNIYGLGLSFETLTSKVNIDTVTENGFTYWRYPASGKTILRNTFVTLNPFIGHKYSYRKMSFDLLAGLDLSFCLKSKEEGKVSTNNKDYITGENDKAKPSIDFRPRIQFKAQYDKFGFIVGYSLGIVNFQTQNNLKAYSSFLRLGLSYKLK